MNQKDCVTPPKEIAGLHYTIKQFLPVAVSQVHRDDVLELNWRIRTHCYPLVLRLEKEKKYILIQLYYKHCKYPLNSPRGSMMRAGN